MTATQDFLTALHDKLESLHDDLDGFAGQFGCDDASDVSFGSSISIEGLEEAGLNHEEAVFFFDYVEKNDHATLKYAAHQLYWDAQD